MPWWIWTLIGVYFFGFVLTFLGEANGPVTPALALVRAVVWPIFWTTGWPSGQPLRMD